MGPDRDRPEAAAARKAEQQLHPDPRRGEPQRADPMAWDGADRARLRPAEDQRENRDQGRDRAARADHRHRRLRSRQPMRERPGIGPRDEQHRGRLRPQRRFELAPDIKQHDKVEDEVQHPGMQESRGQRGQHKGYHGPRRQHELAAPAAGNEACTDDRVDLESGNRQQHEKDDAGERVARDQRRRLRFHRLPPLRGIRSSSPDNICRRRAR